MLPIWVLVLARVSGACMTAPVTVVPGVAWHLRILLSLMLGVVLIPVLEPLIGSFPGGPRVAWLALMELLVGGYWGYRRG